MPLSLKEWLKVMESIVDNLLLNETRRPTIYLWLFDFRQHAFHYRAILTFRPSVSSREEIETHLNRLLGRGFWIVAADYRLQHWFQRWVVPRVAAIVVSHITDSSSVSESDPDTDSDAV